MIERPLCLCFMTLFVFAFVRTATAQFPRFEAAGGYQLVQTDEQTLPVGWSADVAANLTRSWSMVAEAGGAYNRVPDQDLGSDVSLAIQSYGAGARWSLRRAAIVPFVQMLAGVTRLDARAEVRGATIGDSSTWFMLQSGGGVNVSVHQGWGIVGQVDYRHAFANEDEGSASEAHQFRALVGVRVGF
jgi:hypothetical protein